MYCPVILHLTPLDNIWIGIEVEFHPHFDARSPHTEGFRNVVMFILKAAKSRFFYLKQGAGPHACSRGLLRPF